MTQSTIAEDWFTRIYDTEWLKYVASAIDQEQTQREVDFLITALNLGSGGRLLDLACGHGRHSLELARRGISVVGQDLSTESLAVARSLADTTGLDITFHQADMRTAVVSGVDAVISMWGSFGYLESDAENEQVFSAIRLALRPGGQLFLDLINPTYPMVDREARVWWPLAEGAQMIEHRAYCAETGRWEVERSITKVDGTRTELSQSLRIYTLVEITAMLSSHGMQLLHTFGAYDGQPFDIARSPRMIVVATVR